jgi:uncharacterized damage-inducible protein DinB
MNKKALIDGLRLNIAILRDFIAAIPEGEIEKRRKEDYWSIREHLSHLVITQIMLCKRLELFIKEERPVIVPYVPEGKPDTEGKAKKPIGELLDSFEKWRERQLGFIESCGDEVWPKSAEHPEYLAYSFETLIRHILLHDSYHMNRIEELWLLKDEYLKNW